MDNKDFQMMSEIIETTKTNMTTEDLKMKTYGDKTSNQCYNLSKEKSGLIQYFRPFK